MSDFKPPVPSSELIDVRTSLDTKHRHLVESLEVPPALPLDVRTSIETEHRKLVDNGMLSTMSTRLPMHRMGE
jgi:hypothetical protein